MLVCLDVHYTNETAAAAAIEFNHWGSESSVRQHLAYRENFGDYVPGEFYKRELPLLVAVLSEVKHKPEVVIIDGYCQLSAHGVPGLGAYLYERLGFSAVVVGVAKNRFKDSKHAAEVLRGDSRKPLFVTAIGLPNEEAASLVRRMHGKFRLPTMLKRVDSLARASCVPPVLPRP